MKKQTKHLYYWFCFWSFKCYCSFTRIRSSNYIIYVLKIKQKKQNNNSQPSYKQYKSRAFASYRCLLIVLMVNFTPKSERKQFAPRLILNQTRFQPTSTAQGGKYPNWEEEKRVPSAHNRLRCRKPFTICKTRNKSHLWSPTVTDSFRFVFGRQS